MNHVTIIGRLTADPELRKSNTGNPVTTMRIAVERRGADAGADFINVTTFGAVAESTAKYLAKGRRVAIAGRLHHNTWTDQSNGRHESHVVVAQHVEFLDAPKERNGQPAAAVSQDAF